MCVFLYCLFILPVFPLYLSSFMSFVKHFEMLCCCCHYTNKLALPKTLILLTLRRVYGGHFKHFKADYRSHKEMSLGFVLIQYEHKYTDFLLVFQETKCCDLFSLFCMAITSHRRLIIVLFYHGNIVYTRQIQTKNAV